MKAPLELIITEFVAREGVDRILTLEGEAARKQFPPGFLLALHSQVPQREPDLRTPLEKQAVIAEVLEMYGGDGSSQMPWMAVSEGGIFSAFWQFAERMKCGLSVDIDKIPISQYSIEICEYFQLDPYYLQSGPEVVLAAVENGALVTEKLRERGIHAVVTGCLTDGHDRLIHQREHTRYLDRPREDELVRYQRDKYTLQI